MKKQKNYKQEKGITLVALVVTIVVLLILAGISISMVLGNNGLITKAKEAKVKTEQDALNTDKTINSLVDEMESILGNGGNEDEDSGDTIDLSTLVIGDYVNYTYDIVSEGYPLPKTQSGCDSGYDDDQTITQSATTLQWRILNIDEENGTIDLVSATPTDNTVYFKGAIGYNNGVYLLNDMCAHLYSNSSLGITARSINLIDMERHLTTTGIAARNAYKSGTDTLYGSTYTYASNRYYPDLYANEIGQGIGLSDGTTITQPNLNGVDPYNESSKYYSTPTTETSTRADTALTVTQTYYYIPINEANYGLAATVLSNSDYYWVASRLVNAYDSSYAFFGLRRADTEIYGNYIFHSDGSNVTAYSRLRPVVTLSSSLLDGTKDEDGAWNLKSEIE